MISEELKELIRPAILVQKILWFIIVGSIIFYIGFVYIFLGANKALAAPVGSTTELLIYILAGAVTIVSIIYYYHALSDGRLKRFMSKDADLDLLAKDPRSNKIDEAKLAKLKPLSAYERKIYSLMFELQKITLLSLILLELMVILGSALAFLNEDASIIVPFGIVSLVLCFWMFPRAQSLIRRVLNFVE